MPFLANPASEAAFWKQQLVEHAMFTAGGLTDPVLKSQAQSLYQQVPSSIAGVADLASALNQLHTTIIALLQRGDRIGDVSIPVINHMVREQTWYLRGTIGWWTPRDLICFGDTDAAEAASFVKTALSSKPEFQAISQFLQGDTQVLLSLASSCDRPIAAVASDSIEDVIALGERLRSQGISQNTPPLMVEHELREQLHFIGLLKSLQMSGTI